MEIKKSLTLRRKANRKRPGFGRQEGLKRLKDSWRRPTGRRSKLRQEIKGRGSVPSTGYRSPAISRGLDNKGLMPVRVFNLDDVSSVDHKTNSIIIGSSVGKRKREEIVKYANEKKIRILN